MLFQKSKGGFMSQDVQKSLLITGPANIIGHIQALVGSYIDGGYAVVVKVVEPPNQNNGLTLEWKKLRPNIEIQGIVDRVGLDGIWVFVGLPDNPTFFVSIPDQNQRRTLSAKTLIKLKVISFDRGEKALNMRFLSRLN